MAQARWVLDRGDGINRGLVAFWPMNENGGGSLLDISGRRVNAPLTGSPNRGVNLGGRAVTFNGTTQYAVAANTLPSFTQFTVSAWIKPGFASTSNTERALFSRYTAVGPNHGMRVDWPNASLGWYFHDVTAGGIAFATQGNTPAFAAGELHHIALTVIQGTGTGGTVQFYWDGRRVTTNYIGGSGWVPANLTSIPFYIGQDGDGTKLWSGDISGMRVHNRALRPGEISRIYREPNAGLMRLSYPSAALPPLSATITGTVDITASIAAQMALDATLSGTVPITALISATLESLGGDTHDGFVRRSRRERRLDALRARADDERLNDAQALRIALEAALDGAQAIPAPVVVAAVEAAPRAADVDWQRIIDDAAEYTRLARVVARLQAMIQAEAKRQADDEDDDDAMFLMGAV